MPQSIDFKISNHEIKIKSVLFSQENIDWDDEGLEQGVSFGKGYAIFDPIAEGEFFAKINISLKSSYEKDKNALRAIVVPFEVISANNIYLLSMETYHKIDINLEKAEYSLYFEVCEPEDIDEVYYNITFVKEKTKARYLIDDIFGAKKETEIF
ncbi:competence protein ComJ [Aliarcobacter vitoriensis]|uniref:competence protein ComJ n=1 Tax=Aliarcobacter vitoriensis TaxID=2011099 RepID=UPI003AAFCF2D